VMIARGRALATAQVNRARDLLAQLKPSTYRNSLAALIDDQIDRED